MQTEVAVTRPTVNAGLLRRGAAVLIAALAGLWLASAFGSSHAVTGAQTPQVRPLSSSLPLSSLPLAAQAPVSAALGRADSAYWVHGLRATNPINRFGVRFAAGAVTVASGRGHVRFSLSGFGAPSAKADRITYRSGDITQSYTNGPLGLEQSFVVRHGPAGRIALPMTIAGNLRASLSAGTVLLTGAGTALRYDGLIATDARGRRLPASIQLRGRHLTLSVDARNAVYPVRIDPWVASGNLNEAAGAPYDGFGYSAAVSGSTIAIGAPALKVGSNASQGAVFVFTEPSTGWASSTTSKMLVASNGAASDGLGFSVATNGTTIVSGNEHAAAYVFAEHNGAWPATQTYEMTVPAGIETYNPVAISPDGKTIAVGAENATVGTNADQGEVLAFTEPGGGWGTGTPAVAALTAQDGAAHDDLGLEIAANNDDIAAVGPTTAVYVWTKTTAWAPRTQSAELQDGSAQQGGSGALAISPDGKTVAVSAQYLNPGEVFVFAENGTSWGDESAPSATLTAQGGAVGDNFGFDVGASDDELVVSAPGETIGATAGIGAAYVYDEPATGWSGNLTQTQELTPATTTAGAVGWSLGFDGATIVLGAHAQQQGAFVFTNPAEGGGGGPTAPPVNTVAPAIGGTAKAGKTLTCSDGTWTNSPTAYAYAWAIDGTPISGATKSTYKLQTGDEGLKITCTVTAANAKGNGKPATSHGISVPVPKVKRCPAATGSVSATAIGLAHLGVTRTQILHAYTHSSTRGAKDKEFFCLTPHGLRVGLASSKLIGGLPRSERGKLAGRVVWISTDNARYAVKGIRAGATLAASEKALPRGYYFKLGANYWYLAPDGKNTAVLKVRHDLVEEIGIADKQITGTHKADRTLMNSFD